MGRRGPPRTPTKTLEMRGSWLAKQRKGEPTPVGSDAKAPSCPTWVGKIPYAQKCWKYHVRKLSAIGLLAMLDRNVFARYCVTWARYRQAEDVITEHGATMVPVIDTTDDGDPVYGEEKDRPEVARSIRLQGVIDKLERKLGLSPSDRANFAIDTKAKTTNSVEEQLFGAG